jgi:hypothetical protein
MRVIALDPGTHTGVCIYDTKGSIFEVYTLGPEEHHLTLLQELQEFEPDHVVWERFQYQRRELTKGVSLVLDSREYIGIAKLYCQQHVAVTRHEQTPAQAKNLWTDQKLKKLGLWEMTKSAHERDALRHMLYFLVVTRGDRSWVMKLKD